MLIPDNLVVLEMANNHMGNVNHGIELINAYGKIVDKYRDTFTFCFKFQFRDLDTFIHKDAISSGLPLVKRFQETRLSKKEFNSLFSCARKNKFLTMVTCFDNKSLKSIDSYDIDFLKVASCSFTDWPLLEDIVEKNKPIIASTASASEKDIEHVVTFFGNRTSNFAIMHCIAEYPTLDENLNLSQIDYLLNKFPSIRVGYSTHEDPDNTINIQLAIAKGASIFEKHVALPSEQISVNKYSTTPKQFEEWLDSAAKAFKLCGDNSKRYKPKRNELKSIRSLQRGIFAKDKLKVGDIVDLSNTYFAFPPTENQFTANDFSKYSRIVLTDNCKQDEVISNKNAKLINEREILNKIEDNVQEILKKAMITLPKSISLEISHHYGLDKFNQFGMCIFTLINRSYCKKLLILLPGQHHPAQYHKKKEETFRLLYGDVELILDKEKLTLNPGGIITIEPKQIHEFSSKNGCIIEEISSTHFTDDSYYVDAGINKSLHRKTVVTFFQQT